MAGDHRWQRNGAASPSREIPRHGPSTTIPRASGATAGQNSFSGSWPTPANYADPGTRSRCTISVASRTSTPGGGHTSPNGPRGWPHAAARPLSSAASARGHPCRTSHTANTMSTGEPDATEIGHVRFGEGPSIEKDQVNWHLVGGLLYRKPCSGRDGRKRTRPRAPRRRSTSLEKGDGETGPTYGHGAPDYQWAR